MVLGGGGRPQRPDPAHRFSPGAGIYSSNNTAKTPKATVCFTLSCSMLSALNAATVASAFQAALSASKAQRIGNFNPPLENKSRSYERVIHL